jgi:uncharacterized protein YdeI (YjbR/CyaY-like superfamily)
MCDIVTHSFLNRKEWRKWLKENHVSEKEVWVIIQKKKSVNKGLRYKEAVEEAICFGWIDSKMQRIDNYIFRQRFSPRKKNSVWSKINKETAKEMIRKKRMVEAGFEKVKEAKRNGNWKNAYSSKKEINIPKDLENALKENNLAWETFNVFSNSKKFQYIYWINNAKREDTRKKRIKEIVKKLQYVTS